MLMQTSCANCLLHRIPQLTSLAAFAGYPHRAFVATAHGPASSSAACRHNVTAASFGGGHRVFDDRVVYPEPDRNDETGKRLAILKGAARAANMTDEMFKAKFTELGILLPGMSGQRLLQLDRNLLAQLASDTAGVARRLISLQDLFPTADLAKLVSKRPGLLLESIFEHVPVARAELAELFPSADIDAMVQEQPLLLTEDVASCIEELRRLMPMADPLQTLRYNPHILLSVMGNRGLSLW